MNDLRHPDLPEPVRRVCDSLVQRQHPNAPIWLEVAAAASPDAGDMAQRGRLLATQFFFRYELPKIGAWLKVVESRDMTCAEFPEEAF